MGRPKKSQNTHYHFEVLIDDNKTMCRTVRDVADILCVGSATVVRKLRNPEIILNKFKQKKLLINRVNVPIFKQIPQLIEYI